MSPEGEELSSCGHPEEEASVATVHRLQEVALSLGVSNSLYLVEEVSLGVRPKRAGVNRSGGGGGLTEDTESRLLRFKLVAPGSWLCLLVENTHSPVLQNKQNEQASPTATLMSLLGGMNPVQTFLIPRALHSLSQEADLPVQGEFLQVTI